MKTLFSIFTMIMSLFVVSLSANYEDYENNEATELLGFDDDYIDTELGAIFKRVSDPSLRNKIESMRKRRRADRSKRYKRANISRGQGLLYAHSKEMTPSMQKAFAKGTVKFTDEVLFYTKGGYSAISAISDMVESNDIIGTGYSNLKDGGIVPKNVAMAIDFITFKWSEYVILDGIFSAAITSSNNNDAIWQVLELEVLVNDRKVLRIPIGNMNEKRVVKGQAVNVDDSVLGFNLKKKVVVQEDDVLQFKVHAPKSTTITPVALSKFALRVELYGDATQGK